MAKFEKLRVSLAPVPDSDLFGDTALGPRRDRRVFLEEIFGESRTFLGRGREQVIGFDPIPAPNGYVAGFFKRERPLPARRRDLEPYIAENYELALFVMSVEKDQIAWIQDNYRIGSPRSILESFFNYFSKSSDFTDYIVNVRFMDSGGEYFEVLERRYCDVAMAKFTFLPPNALGGADAVKNFVKTIDREAHPATQTHLYKGAPGSMNLKSETLAASAQVAMDGGGEAELRDVDGRIIYHSALARTQENVPNEELPTPGNPNFVKRVISWLYERVS